VRGGIEGAVSIDGRWWRRGETTAFVVGRRKENICLIVFVLTGGRKLDGPRDGIAVSVVFWATVLCTL